MSNKNNNGKPVVALFDFDGTLTHQDIYLQFTQHVFGWKFFAGLALLSPILVLYFLKLIKNNKAKEMATAFFFKGWDSDKFLKTAVLFCENQLPKMLRKEAVDRLEWHKKNKHRVIIVSANFREIIESWCKKMEVEHLSTELEIVDGKITGNFKTNNCYGAEKVFRIKAVLTIAEYEIYAYGDSDGDKEMLALAQHPYFKKFN